MTSCCMFRAFQISGIKKRSADVGVISSSVSVISKDSGIVATQNNVSIDNNEKGSFPTLDNVNSASSYTGYLLLVGTILLLSLTLTCALMMSTKIDYYIAIDDTGSKFRFTEYCLELLMNSIHQYELLQLKFTNVIRVPDNYTDSFNGILTSSTYLSFTDNTNELAKRLNIIPIDNCSLAHDIFINALNNSDTLTFNKAVLDWRNCQFSFFVLCIHNLFLLNLDHNAQSVNLGRDTLQSMECVVAMFLINTQYMYNVQEFIDVLSNSSYVYNMHLSHNKCSHYFKSVISNDTLYPKGLSNTIDSEFICLMSHDPFHANDEFCMNYYFQLSAYVKSVFSIYFDDKITDSKRHMTLITLVWLAVIAICVVSCIEFANKFKQVLIDVKQFAQTVENKSQEISKNKKQKEGLLNQMLPKSVADKLRTGKSVEAECFDMVSIYFSDIIGFNDVALNRSPLEIVDFLNSIYG